MDFPESKISIQASDVISGSLYLKLIEDFKQYDNERKNYIGSLHDKIDKLKYQIELKEWEIRSRKLYEEIDTQSVPHLQYKLFQYRLLVKKLRAKLRNLKNENLSMKNEIIKLKMKINGECNK